MEWRFPDHHLYTSGATLGGQTTEKSEFFLQLATSHVEDSPSDAAVPVVERSA